MAHTVYETSGHLMLEINMKRLTYLAPAARFASRPEPGGEMGGWTRGTKGRREESRQGGGSEAGKEGGSEAERTKEEGKEGGREVRLFKRS